MAPGDQAAPAEELPPPSPRPATGRGHTPGQAEVSMGRACLGLACPRNRCTNSRWLSRRLKFLEKAVSNT